MTTGQAVALIVAELERARAKFPAGFHSGHEGYAVILEEIEELWDAVKADDLDAQSAEAVQIGAMALRYLVEVIPTPGLTEKPENASVPNAGESGALLTMKLAYDA